MTFEEACKALGYDEPLEWMSENSRAALIETAEELTDNGTKPADPQAVNRVHAEVEMFG